MRDRQLTLSEKMRAVPLLRALVPLVAGIVCGTFIEAPLYVWAVACAVCGATAFFARKHFIVASIYIALAILFFGAALARLHTPQIVIPRGERLWLEVWITDNPSLREGSRSARTSGIIMRWRSELREGDGSSPQGGRQAEWQPAGEKLLVGFDTMYRFGLGDRIVFRGYVNPVSDSTTSYSRLMTARGYTGRTYISRYSRPEVSQPAESGNGNGGGNAGKSVGVGESVGAGVGEKRFFGSLFSPGSRGSVAALAKRLQSSATSRLYRLTADGTTCGAADEVSDRASATTDAIAVAAAMTTGDRTRITPELREAYARTGASHLLAVSGLHVGIVFLMINLLLYLLPMVRGGHIIRNILAIIAIWFYASLTGLSPSATRAAFMFTGAQIALASSRSRSATNIMCGTALLMLAVRPGLLFDISFQLSFIAVAAIMAWFPPLYRLVENRYRWLNALWATLLIGLVASTATMPLVSHTFGVFSPFGVVLNPIVILTAHLTVVFSLVWIIAPIPVLEPVFRWLVGAPAWLQNRVVELVGTVPGSAVEWTMPLWMVFAVYAAMIIFTAWISTVNGK